MRTTHTLKTVALLAGLTALFILIGRLIGGTSGMAIAFVVALAMNLGSYWFSDRIVLAMAGAREVSPTEAPALHRLVEQLASRARIPKPRVYLIDDPSPNAFATGRDPAHGAVAVTTGLLDILDWQELAGVLAHELGHIRNRDTLIATVAATIAGAITMLANLAQWTLLFGGSQREDEAEAGGWGSLVGGILMIVLAPLAATIIQLAISRARELHADATGAALIGDPDALARALEKLEMGTRLRPMAANPGAAHLFIVNPLNGGALLSLFSTHPPIAERIARLRRLRVQLDLAPLPS